MSLTPNERARQDQLDSRRATLKMREEVLEAALECRDETRRTPRCLQNLQDHIVEARAELESHYVKFPEDRS